MNEIKLKPIIRMVKMSSKQCLAKHQKQKALEAETKKRVLSKKITIVKAKDIE